MISDFVQSLDLCEQYNVMSAVRGPDSYKVEGTSVLKSAFTARFRAIVWGLVGVELGYSDGVCPVPGDCHRLPMTRDGADRVITALKEMNGPGARHYVTHLFEAMRVTGMVDHAAWGGHGKRLIGALNDRLYGPQHGPFTDGDRDKTMKRDEDIHPVATVLMDELNLVRAQRDKAQDERRAALNAIKGVLDAQKVAHALISG